MSDLTVAAGVASVIDPDLFSTWPDRPDYFQAAPAISFRAAPATSFRFGPEPFPLLTALEPPTTG